VAVSTVALSLPLLTTDDDTDRTVSALTAQLDRFEVRNRLKVAYYEGEQTVRQLGIAIPPSMTDLETVIGWPGTAVDVLEERLDWLGWTQTDADFGLRDVYVSNSLNIDSGLAHLDALIYGTAFAAVGSGVAGEPNPLVTVHSPRQMTGIRDGRTRRLSSAVAITDTRDGVVASCTLYLPNETLFLERNRVSGTRWAVVGRDRHNLGRVPVAQFVNRPRASRMGGRSEISRAVRSYTDQAVRTLLGMEINREFYSSPHRWALGVDEQAFQNADGTQATGFQAIMGHMLALSRDENGDLPQVGQFTPASPAPYLEQVKGLAQLFAAEAAIPASYLGFTTENPSSADAIRQGETRLVKRAERRQTSFGETWLEVGRLALLVRDGRIPEGFAAAVSNDWVEASTPTRASASDEAVKLIGAGVLLPDSTVTYRRVGLSLQDQAQLVVDKRRQAGRGVLTALRDAAAARSAPVVADADNA
jgi:hypothetical protein